MPQKNLIESFQAPVYSRTPRNQESYRATYRYCYDRLSDMIELYQLSSNSQQTQRLIRDDLDNVLRRYHGYCIKERIGAHYRERDYKGDCDFEHLIPAARIRDMMIAGVITIDQALNCPTVSLSRDHHRLLKEAGWASHTPNAWIPFQRYSQLFSGEYITYDGREIDAENWSLDDHYEYFQHLVIK